MRVAAKTDVGQVRLMNEDSYSVGELPSGVVWAIVCDGMGGASGGDIASQTAVKMISETISTAFRQQMGGRTIKNMLFSAIQAANARIFDLAAANEALQGMGTTVVAAVITPEAAYIAHVGDSRAYLSTGGQLIQLTKDHSVVQAMVDNGQITEDEAKIHPHKNLITRAVGVGGEVDIDFCEETLRKDDVLLLCTDGLTNMVELADIQRQLLCGGALCTDDLIAMANQNGGQDNITVVTIAL
ncbi:MAG: Stp1/IreP family PP2C-type Ser/Thr phosphatase [Oscillospiraceae bacterium]|jgi:protein phosphatase|nr:Stp1/IreP family PP2C-type Ser/Thr phosphatase [Oscillospiraceae bacterium]